jgi:arsenite methyltransferase
MKEEILKAKIRERYGKIALSGNSDCCCTPQECNSVEFNPKLSSISIGYNDKELEAIPETSILGVGCGAPLNFADLKEGDTVLDLGSGAGIDAFLASKIVKESGKVIGIDFTHEMLMKSRKAAAENGFKNVEFKKGDIENNIPVVNNSVDAAISNCVINLTKDKVKTFREIYRILKKGGMGRMIISDLITSKEVEEKSVNSERWCSCVDGALTKENYLKSIEVAGFQNIEILSEEPYLNEKDGRKITSLVIRAVTN